MLGGVVGVYLGSLRELVGSYGRLVSCCRVDRVWVCVFGVF